MSLGRKECHSIGKNSGEKRAEVVSYRSNIRTWAYIKLLKAGVEKQHSQLMGTFARAPVQRKMGVRKRGSKVR